MELTVVNASTGRTTGSAESRRMRRTGRLPGVVYGLDQDSISIDVEYTELREALNTDAGLNTIIALEIEGTENPVIVRAIQRDVISRKVIHTDFLRIDLDAAITVTVPVQLVGTAVEVIDAGSFVEQALFDLEVKVKPADIPDVVEVDISEMSPDSSLSVGDVVLPEGCVAVTSSGIAVASAVITRASKMADEDEAFAEEAAEEAEGDESSDSEESE